MQQGALASNLNSRGLWRLGDGAPLLIDPDWTGPTTVLVPSEDVLTVVVDLPFASRAQRVSALPFALEEAVAEPLAALHCALGMEISPRRHLAGVVRHSRMRDWTAALSGHDLENAILIPDALTLPLPSSGAWTVRTDEGRALVRTDQGTGFALPVRDLPTVWAAAGKPRLSVMGGDLPEALREGIEADAVLLGSVTDPVMIALPLDLCQGPYAVVRKGAPSALKTAALIAGVGVVALVGLLALDTFLLHRMAERREVEVRATLASVSPQLADAPDLIAAADRATPQASGAPRPFTRLMSEVSGAATNAGLTYARIDYDDPGTVILNVTVPDAAALTRAITALSASGLNIEGGPRAAAADTPLTNGVSAEIRIGARR